MIAVLIPALNEEKAIKQVVKGFPSEYRGEEVEIFVVDGGSTDRTVEEAEKAGAKVLHQSLEGGKGNGVKQALNQVDAEIHVMIDGDGSYNPSEMSRLVDPLLDGEAQHVIGRRSEREKGSIPRLNLIGNKIFNWITTITTGKKIRDMLSGYRAFTNGSLKFTDVTMPGFGIETEMTMSALENNVSIKEVDVSYRDRKGESKLDPFSDGWRILNTIIWSIRDMNPLKFFSGISIFLLLAAAYPSFLTVRQKLAQGFISDLAPALAASVLLILAVQFFIFGLIADQIKNVERRLRNRI